MLKIENLSDLESLIAEDIQESLRLIKRHKSAEAHDRRVAVTVERECGTERRYRRRAEYQKKPQSHHEFGYES